MKKGKTLTELAQRLEQIRETARDYIVPMNKLEMGHDGTLSYGENSAPVNSWAHSQIASFSNIPKQYYDRIRTENSALLANNVNHAFTRTQILSAESGKKDHRMIRTLDGNVRAFLGSKYRRLDCYDLLEAVFPVLEKNGITVESSEITESKLYLQCTTPRLTVDVKKGDAVQYGLVISSSDVGAGSVRVEPMIYRLVCSNGLIMPVAMRKYHSGKEQASDDIYEILSDETKALSDQAFWNQVRDIVTHSCKEEVFYKEVRKLAEAAHMPITSDNIEQVVELSMKSVGVVGETKKNSIVAALARGADGAGMTKWGLMNAFTEVAQKPEVDYDESIQMQRAAGKLLEIPVRQWLKISEAV